MKRDNEEVTGPDPLSLSEGTIARQLAARRLIRNPPDTAQESLGVRKAAVLVPMFWSEEAWSLLFTERSQSVEEHAGQVSFPGGQSHGEMETAVQTALRETEEEIGLPSDRVRVLGLLDPFETVTGFLVTPVIGAFSWPASLQPSAIEVREIFHVPLRWLAQDSNLQWQPRPRSLPGNAEWVPVYHSFGGHLIWGATARIVVAFLQVLGIDLRPHGRPPSPT
jgi:8-oxo-dGTP pyrophosphatase MutT (NUDIX family)